MNVELAAFALSANLYVEVTGQLFSDTNTYVNVNLRDSTHKSAEVQNKEGNIRSSVVGRAEGEVDCVPPLMVALRDLMDKISGQEIWFGDRRIKVPTLVLGNYSGKVMR